MENLQNLREKPLWQMTGEEFLALQASQIQTSIIQPPHEKKLIYGVKSCATLFDCSMATAWKILKSGVIDDAVYRVGRKIAIDPDKALSLVQLARKRKSKKLS